VGCASQKLKRPAPARELYVYQLFKKASAYAELTCDRWYLLSAKHGLVHPDTVLEPYDMRLGTNHRTSPPIHQWGARVKEQFAAELAGLENVTLVALAGEQYRIAMPGSRWPVEIPMKGLGIGQQLGWLTEQLSADRFSDLDPAFLRPKGSPGWPGDALHCPPQKLLPRRGRAGGGKFFGPVVDEIAGLGLKSG
jgi:hypothetical protein